MQILSHLGLMIKGAIGMTKYYDKGKCPVCGSENISYDGDNRNSDYIYYRGICNDCNTTFDEYYELIYAGLENIIRGDKDEKDKNV